jgi:hypothetical protein
MDRLNTRSQRCGRKEQLSLVRLAEKPPDGVDVNQVSNLGVRKVKHNSNKTNQAHTVVCYFLETL